MSLRGKGERSPTTRSPGNALVPRPDDTVLVPVPDAEPGVFAVLGSPLPAGVIDVQALPLVPPGMDHMVAEQLGLLAGAANAGVQLAAGWQAANGLVRLAPETLAALKAGSVPIKSGGWNLGTLASDGGQWSASVRWLPAGGVTATAIVSQVAPALVMLAIQWQLTQIGRQVETNIRVTSEVLRAIRTEKWNSVRADVERVLGLFEEASALGQVTPAVMREAHGLYASLNPRRAELLEELEHHQQMLDRTRSVSQRNEWLTENGAVMLRDVQSALAAAQGCFIYEAMRAASLWPEHEAHAQKVADTALARFAADRRQIEASMTMLTRGLDRVAEDPGRHLLNVGPRKRKPREVADAARILAEALSTLGFDIEPPLMNDPLEFFVSPDDWTDDEVRQVSLLLEPGETLLGLGYFTPGEAFMVTDQRWAALAQREAFRVRGQVRRADVTEVAMRRWRGHWHADLWIGEERGMSIAVASTSSADETEAWEWGDALFGWASELQDRRTTDLAFGTS